MDQVPLSSTSVLQALLKTNRPPTDEERAIIQESMAPANEEFRVVKEQISETMAHIQALKSQLEQAEIALQRLHKKELAIWECTADQRRALSCFRDFPEDVLREICIACTNTDIPELTLGRLASSYRLMQISSGMRRIVLETPSIWASINIRINSPYQRDELQYMTLVCEAKKWVERAGGSALSISVDEFLYENEIPYAINTLFDFLFSYSKRWKSIRIHCGAMPTLVTRIAALSAVDVPVLRSASLYFESHTSAFINSTFLTTPTLEHLKLELYHSRTTDFTVNWALLTSLTLRQCNIQEYLSVREIAKILQQTKLLAFCDITIEEDFAIDADYLGEINLMFLKILYLEEDNWSSGHPDILQLIHAPILEICQLRGEFLRASASIFFKRSPNIQELRLCQVFSTDSLKDTTDMLHHCPSLTTFSLQRYGPFFHRLDGNEFLDTFIQGDNIIICPQLEYFTLGVPIDISLQTLRHFLESKQRTITTPSSFRTWKSVIIDLTGISKSSVRRQMSEMFAEKRDEGLHVSVYKVR